MTDNILNNFYSLNFGDKSHSSFSRLSIRGLALACASLSALCTAPALAADASAPAAEDAPEIVVTAQKREESLQKVPISIGVLSGKTLVTTDDTGGVLEFATPESGFIAGPTPQELGAAMTRAWNTAPSRLKEMAEVGRQKVAPIQWDAVIDTLTESIRW